MTEQQEGLYVETLQPGSVIDVETKSRHYRIECMIGDQVKISGHPQLCPVPTPAQLTGSARGSGTFKPGYVGCGMHLVFRRFNERIPVTTSEIVGIQVENPVHEHV
jgi:hypothetical protein